MEQYYIFLSFCAGVIATLLVDVITRSSSKKPGKPSDKPKQGDTHGYYVERFPKSQGGEIYLKNNEGACLGIMSINYCLGSKVFKNK